MTDILGPLEAINVERQVSATVVSFAQNVIDIDSNFDAIRVAVNALCDRIAILESRVTGSPVLTNFHITAPARVDAGTTLTGNSYNATYDISAATLVTAARLVGFQSLPTPGAETVIVSDALRAEGSNTQAFTFPSGADFATEGNAYTLRMELYTAGQTPGTDTPAQSALQVIVAQAAPRADMLYWGVSTDNTPANVNVAALDSQTRLDGDVVLPTWSDNQYVIFAYPATAPAVTALTSGGINQLGAFTLTENAITVESISYNTLISGNLIIGSVASGTTFTITR